MTKVIKVDDMNYKRLLVIIHELETVSNKRASFDDAISLLIDEYERRKVQTEKQINEKKALGN